MKRVANIEHVYTYSYWRLKRIILLSTNWLKFFMCAVRVQTFVMVRECLQHFAVSDFAALTVRNHILKFGL